MVEGNSVKGAVLGTVFIVNGLLFALKAKGVMTAEEIRKLLDSTLYTMENAQADDFPDNARVWAEARTHVEQIMAAHSSVQA